MKTHIQRRASSAKREYILFSVAAIIYSTISPLAQDSDPAHQPLCLASADINRAPYPVDMSKTSNTTIKPECYLSRRPRSHFEHGKEWGWRLGEDEELGVRKGTLVHTGSRDDG